MGFVKERKKNLSPKEKNRRNLKKERKPNKAKDYYSKRERNRGHKEKKFCRPEHIHLKNEMCLFLV